MQFAGAFVAGSFGVPPAISTASIMYAGILILIDSEVPHEGFAAAYSTCATRGCAGSAFAVADTVSNSVWISANLRFAAVSVLKKAAKNLTHSARWRSPGSCDASTVTSFAVPVAPVLKLSVKKTSASAAIQSGFVTCA